MAGTGVTVTSIYPGFISSGFHERIAGPDEKLLGSSHLVDYTQAMTPVRCANLIIRAMVERKREVLISFRIKLGLWLKLIAPKFVDKLAIRAIQRGK